MNRCPASAHLHDPTIACLGISNVLVPVSCAINFFCSYRRVGNKCVRAKVCPVAPWPARISSQVMPFGSRRAPVQWGKWILGLGVLLRLTDALTCPNFLLGPAPADGPNQNFVLLFDTPATPNDAQSVTCVPNVSTPLALGATGTLVCIARDHAGLEVATCQVAYAVADATPPLISCPADISADNDIGLALGQARFADPSVVDQSVTDLSCVPSSGAQLPLGQTQINCTVTDAFNLSSSCLFSATIRDVEAPNINCPTNRYRSVTAPNTEGDVYWSAPFAGDNSGAGVDTFCSHSPGTVFALGTHVVACNATDPSGNTAFCSFLVTVSDGNTDCYERWSAWSACSNCPQRQIARW
ncbi:uncharacterized protein MONBRDRAFT_12678 [Monosiga brevicollis MX1]|uniref:HYR domain-containing protein n=1 Tax=Monosiga brevicollis TaxID=81824 RepID=A9VCZ9_MONBE|nr:uncharacterized protein MONBRDRAFT_12678 [Monosiga brevicollis MX1]EDQ84590.1 predicted protein [Monosiga brevicollis MX1]|eukprot:XP_001750617.1 hypothetical protein [Monosiga brevicollis MX1]